MIAFNKSFCAFYLDGLNYESSSRFGQYRLVCAKSPDAPQMSHTYLRRRGQRTRPLASLKMCDE